MWGQQGSVSCSAQRPGAFPGENGLGLRCLLRLPAEGPGPHPAPPARPGSASAQMHSL